MAVQNKETDAEFYERMDNLHNTIEKELFDSLSMDEAMFINDNFTIDSMGYIQCPIKNVTEENRKGLESLLAKNVATYFSDSIHGRYTIFNRHIKNLITTL